MKKYTLVIFDVDGTLINAEEGVCAAVNYTIDKYSLQPLTLEELKGFNGPPVQRSFARYYDLSEQKIQELTECFRDRYKNHDLLKAKVYDGIYELFDKLKQQKINIAIATYKREDYARTLLHYLEFNRYTDVIHGADNSNILKKKDIIQKCIVDYGMDDCRNAIMVGDSNNDLEAASEIGMDFLGVTYGFGFKKSEDVLCNSSAIGCAKSPLQIYTTLEKYIKG